MFKPPFNWFNKFGTLPATYKEAMSYEEQIMWLCKEVQRNESYAEEFQAVIDQINESISQLDSDIDEVYRNLNDLASKKEDKLVQGTGLLLHRITPIEGTPTVKISTSPIDVSELLISGSYIPLADKEVGDVIDLEPVTSSNTAYFMKYVEAGEIFEIVGKCDIAKINESNEITLINKNNEGTSFDEPATFITLIPGTLIISFTNTDTNVPEIREFITTDYIFDEINKKQTRLIAGAGISINGDVISATGSVDNYIDLSYNLKQNQYIDFSNKNVGDTLSLEPVSATNTAYYIKEVEIGEQFKIIGSYILAEIDNRNIIVNKESGTATSQNPYIYDCSANIPSRPRFVVTFENTDTNQPSVGENIDQYYTFNRIESSKEIVKLGSDVHLNDSSPDTGLLDGFYFSDGHKVYVNNAEQSIFNNALFYASGNDTLYLIYSDGYYHQNLCFYELFYDRNSNQWTVGSFSARTNWENVPDHPSINNFTQDLNLVDGTSTTGLADGIYFTDNYKVYINGAESNFFNHAVILSYSSDSLYVISSPYNARQPLGFYEVYYNSSTGTWNTGYQGMQTDWSLINNKPAGMENYSTNEQVVGTWINGKPLYQKVLTGTLQDYSTSTVNNDIIVDTNATNVIVKVAQVKRTNGNIYPFSVAPYQWDIDNETNVQKGLAYTIRNNNTIRIIQHDTSNNSATYTIIVCYTKTTD